MKSTRFALVALVLALYADTVSATDLTKVDRSIRREPTYRSSPKYCLLVFGPKAEHHVWLVLHGESLYVDRNGNGDLTDDGDPVPLGKWVETKKHPMHLKESRTKAGDLHLGGLTHEALYLLLIQAPRKVDPFHKDTEDWQDEVDRLWKQTGDGISVLITLDLDSRCYEFLKAGKPEKRTHTSSYWQGALSFASSREAAPVLHFGGRLTFRVVQTELHRDKKENQLIVNLGTIGQGPGTFVAAAIELLPAKLDPQVEIVYPSRQKGKPELIQTLVLEDRC
jgi:hypothetical protein